MLRPIQVRRSAAVLVWVALCAGGGAPSRALSDVDYAAAVLGTPDLVAYWRFSSASGADSVVNGWTGTFLGDAKVGAPGSGPTIPGDDANAALVLDGDGDSVVAGGANPLTGRIGNEATILAWINLDALPSQAGRHFAIAGESHFTNDFDLMINTDDRLHFYTEGGSSAVAANPFTAADIGAWHLLVARFEGGVVNGRSLSIDGVEVARDTAIDHGLVDDPFYIGASPLYPGRFFGGRIDEVALFDRSLSDDEITAIREARPPVEESFFLPKTVKAKRNQSDPSRSTLKAVGVLDTGPDAPDLTGAATLDVGGLHFDIPGLTQDGARFVYVNGGIDFGITPNPYGSSRAKFKLKFQGDFGGGVALDGPLGLRFENAAADGQCTVKLGGGVFGLGRVKGALTEPTLFIQRARAGLKGPGKDALSVIVGLATDGAVPAQASDLTVEFGDRLAATIPAASFRRQGAADVFAGDAGGITKVVVDYAREQIAISGKGLDLGPFAEGGNPVLLTIGRGGDGRSVRVRMGRKGATMKY